MKRFVLGVLLTAAGCKTSIDFEQGRPYSCVPDAGEDATATCGAGWRCGLEGRCHALGDEQPWLCRASTDCEGAWRCGLEGRCHALGDAQAWQCTQSSDCEAGWVCGLEGTCHDPTVLADYLCTEDQHCVSPWRCGFSGRCLDATAELSVIADTTAAELTVLGPRFFTGQPEALVGADLLGNLAISIGAEVRYLSALDAGLFAVTVFDAGTPGRGLMVDTGGAYLVDETGVRSHLVSGMKAGYAADAGGWFAGVTQEQGPFVVHSDQLDFVGNGSQASTLGPQGATAAAVSNCVYFVNAQGVWVQQRGRTGVGPSPLGTRGIVNSSCARLPGVLAISRELVRTGGRNRAVLAFSAHVGRAVAETDGGALFDRNFLSVIDVSALSADAGFGDPQGTDVCTLPAPGRTFCPPARVLELLPYCPVPCDVGDALTDLRPGDQAVEVECTGPLGQTTWSMRYDGECAAQALFGRSSRFREVRTPGDDSLAASHLVQRGPHGQVWVGEGVTRAQPLVLDEPGLAVLRPRHFSDGGLAEPRVVSSTHSTRFDAQLGLLTVPAPESLAFVQGSDDLAVLRSGNVSMLGTADNGTLAVTRRVAALDLSPDELEPPFAAVLAHRAATRVLLVSVRDGLYGAEEASWGRKLPLRLVPQPGFGVLSLAVLPGPSLEGYLSTRASVFAFSSASDLEWKSTPVSLPAGQVVEVWTEGGRARAGFADGRVFTLPSGVPVASALPSGELVDYLGVCGQIFGLSRAGLLRVNGAGQWVPVPLSGGEVVLGETLGGGRLLERDGLVYVFNGSGGALTFRPTPCP